MEQPMHGASSEATPIDDNSYERLEYESMESTIASFGEESQSTMESLDMGVATGSLLDLTTKLMANTKATNPTQPVASSLSDLTNQLMADIVATNLAQPVHAIAPTRLGIATQQWAYDDGKHQHDTSCHICDGDH